MSFFLLEMKAVQNLTAIEKRRVIPLLSSSPILFELCFPTPPDDLADDADGLGHVAAQIHFDGLVALVEAAEKHPMTGQRLDLFDVDFLVDTQIGRAHV